MANNPIVIGSPLKSGTWLIRDVVAEITGLSWCEPRLIKPMDEADPKNILLLPDAFYSWHFTPAPAVRARLRNAQAQVVFVIRNIYAMTVSMYRHFAEDVDHEIGRGAGQRKLFDSLGFEQGLRRIIAPPPGAQRDGFNWDGIGRHLYQMQSILEFAAEYPCAVYSFEQLVDFKERVVRHLAAYFDRRLDDDEICRIVKATDFQAMKARARAKGQGSHFQEGRLRSYQALLTDEHRQLICEQLAKHAPMLEGLAEARGLSHILSWDNAPISEPLATPLARAI